MLRRIILLTVFIVSCMGIRLYAQSNPKPDGLAVPGYNYSETYGCVNCHFIYGARGDHNLEAVGVKFDDKTKVFSLTGNGWMASKHSRSNYRTTQNTFCAKCHSPLQAKAETEFRNGIFKNTEPIADGAVEGVICASCHPSKASAAILGRRLGVYQFGMDKTKPEAYKVVKHGEEDQLCLNCHQQRHSTKNPAFKIMYDTGIKCIDCHMAVYGKNVEANGQPGKIDKRFHDFKVAMNLPFSCGARGSQPGFTCHPEFSVESTLKIIPYLMKQHKEWWPSHTFKGGKEDAATTMRKLDTPEDYLLLWQEFENETQK